MFGELRATGVDQALFGDGDEVRGAVVAEGVLVQLFQIVPIQQLGDAERSELALEIGFRGFILFFLSVGGEPDQADVVGDGGGKTRRLGVGRIVDSGALREIDRRLAMLGRDDDQRVFAKMVLLQRVQHRLELRVDEVETRGEAVVGLRADGVGIAPDQTGILRVLGVALG